MICLDSHSKDLSALSIELSKLASQQTIGREFWESRSSLAAQLATKLKAIDPVEELPDLLKTIALQADQLAAVCDGISLSFETDKIAFYKEQASLNRGLADHFFALAESHEIAA